MSSYYLREESLSNFLIAYSGWILFSIPNIDELKILLIKNDMAKILITEGKLRLLPCICKIN